MRKHFAALAAASLALSLSTAAAPGQSNAKSLGKTSLDAEIGWSVGSGQYDGTFTTAEMQGVVIAMRAQERGQGLLEVSGSNGDRVGVYTAPVGVRDGVATWNFDYHIDLSGAKGNARGRTLADYSLVFEQDYSSQLPAAGVIPWEIACTAGYVDAPAEVGVTLCEQSSNPSFSNDDFDPDEVATYNLRLVLTPETFNGPSVAVAIQVDVTD
jgi:hypothetical protein